METRTDIDVIKDLGAALPDNAKMTFRSEGKTFTGYKAQFIIDRLNEVLGFGWEFNVDRDTDGLPIAFEKDGFVCVLGVLTLYGQNGIDRYILKQVHAYGGSEINSSFDKENDKNFGLPDAYKAAMTDSLCKCASQIGAGADAYRGEVQSENKKDTKTLLTDTDRLINNIKKLQKSKGISDKALAKLAKDALDKVEKVDLTECSMEELNKVYETLEEHDS